MFTFTTPEMLLLGVLYLVWGFVWFFMGYNIALKTAEYDRIQEGS